MKSIRLLCLVALALTASIYPHTDAAASEASVSGDSSGSPKFIVGRTYGYTQVGPAGWERIGTLSITTANLTSGTFDDVAGHALKATPFNMAGYSKVRMILEGNVTVDTAGRAVLAIQAVSSTGASMGNIGSGAAVSLDTGVGAIDAGAKTLAIQLTSGAGIVGDTANTRDAAGAYGSERPFSRPVPQYCTGYVHLALGTTGTITGTLTVTLWGYRG